MSGVFCLDFFLLTLSCSGSQSECVLSVRDQLFLQDVEDLHEERGVENEIDDLMGKVYKEKLKLYAKYCNCQDQERLSRFCKKALAKYHVSDDSNRLRPSDAEALKHSIGEIYFF